MFASKYMQQLPVRCQKEVAFGPQCSLITVQYPPSPLVYQLSRVYRVVKKGVHDLAWAYNTVPCDAGYFLWLLYFEGKVERAT